MTSWHVQNVSQGVTARSKWSKIAILSSDVNIKPELLVRKMAISSQASRKYGGDSSWLLRDGHQSTWPNTATQDFSKTKTVKFYAKPCKIEKKNYCRCQPKSAVTRDWQIDWSCTVRLVHCLLRGEVGILNFQKRKKVRVDAKTLLHSVIIFNWTLINIVCVVSLFTKRASDKNNKYI